MRHRKTGRVLGRKAAARKALLRSLATNMVLYEEVTTTLTKAKAMRPLVERLVTRAGTDTPSNRRALRRVLYVDSAVTKAFKELGPKYKDRAGGYTRITKLAPRKGDGAPMARISFV